MQGSRKSYQPITFSCSTRDTKVDAIPENKWKWHAFLSLKLLIRQRFQSIWVGFDVASWSYNKTFHACVKRPAAFCRRSWDGSWIKTKVDSNRLQYRSCACYHLWKDSNSSPPFSICLEESSLKNHPAQPATASEYWLPRLCCPSMSTSTISYCFAGSLTNTDLSYCK